MRSRLALLAALCLMACAPRIEQVEATGPRLLPGRATRNTVDEQALRGRQASERRADAADRYEAVLHLARAVEYRQALQAATDEIRHKAAAAAERAASHRRAPRPRSEPPAPGSGHPWTALAECESGGNWQSTVGSFEGGLQFLNSTWLAMGGGQYAQHAYDATPGQQIAVAERLLAASGWGSWPACSRRLGLGG